MAAPWEPEELVGRLWHRWASAAPSLPQYPEAGVELKTVRGRLAVMFRAFGGAGAVRIAAAAGEASGHRLRLRQRLGFGRREILEPPSLDHETLRLPERIDCFPDSRLNELLYGWLAVYFAHADAPQPHPADPLQADLLALRRAWRITDHILQHWPGLRARHAELCAATRASRPARRLTEQETAVEQVIHWMLGGAPEFDEQANRLHALVTDRGSLDSVSAGRGYHPFLPVSLWGEVREAPDAANSADAGGALPEPGDSLEVDERRRRAERRNLDRTRRDDALLLSRFEYLLTLMDMLNLSRTVEEEEPAGARQAAASMDELTLGRHERRARTRLKMDLELAPGAAATEPLQGEQRYPEWDYRRRCHHPDHCRVLSGPVLDEGHDWQPDAEARRRIRAVRRRFEALRPRRHVLPMQCDGDELDLSALVRSVADRAAGDSGSDRIYRQARQRQRDLAVALLLDVSLSTDSWVENRRVLDVEKEAVLALGHGLAACGDDLAVYAFSSQRRERVEVRSVKAFEDPMNAAVERRLEALRPGGYTRIGAALRHTAAQLQERPNRHRLLLLLTDGKPNDEDHYEGRYGVEDTRQAIREARRAGLTVFGITVDRRARDYFPYLFGRGAYAIVGRIGRLPAVLPALYRQMTA